MCFHPLTVNSTSCCQKACYQPILGSSVVEWTPSRTPLSHWGIEAPAPYFWIDTFDIHCVCLLKSKIEIKPLLPIAVNLIAQSCIYFFSSLTLPSISLLPLAITSQINYLPAHSPFPRPCFWGSKIYIYEYFYFSWVLFIHLYGFWEIRLR